jgi:hypothetical protein
MTLRHLNKVIGFSFIALLATVMPAQAAPGGGVTATVGDMLTQITSSWSGFPSLFNGAAYILGMIFAARGVFLFKDHVDEAGGRGGNHPLSGGVKHFLAGGALFSLPFMSQAVVGNLLGSNTQTVGFTTVHADPGIGGLDEMVVRFISNISTPATYMLVGFAYLSGILLLITAIIRLTKTAQEGPRGPTGLGTLMTFVSAGALFSIGQMMGVFSGSLFGTSVVNTYASISADVLPADDANIVAPIIEALMIFIMLVGYIAFIRGWFVLKAFADGSQQATLAQALTFLLGGTLAINLGDFVNALQTTVGVSGITFQ